MDYSDPINSLLERVITTLKAFAVADEDWEMEAGDFLKGFPNLNPDERLPRPKVVVYDDLTQSRDIGYDNLLGTNDLLPSHPDYEEEHGVELVGTLFIEVYTTKPTPNNQTPSGGGTVARRIAGKILTRLQGHSECLGDEVDLLDIQDVGMFYPANSHDPQILFRRIELTLSLVVPLAND